MEATQRASEVWSEGSYEEHAANYLPMAAEVVERTGVDDADAVLDVGCGTGSVAVTAARRGADVTGLDVAPDMLDGARENAALAGVAEIDWRVGDAADLPFDDGAFDATLSNLGHMYATPQESAGEELLRVTRSGGRIGFTAWTPTGCYPALGATLVGHVSPADLPADPTEPPFQWGDADVVERRLGDAVEDLAFETGTRRFPALSPAHFWREQERNSGLIATALSGLDESELEAVREDAVEAIRPFYDDERSAVELEYLLTTATVR